MYTSLFMTTTPLVKSFLVEFKVVGNKLTFVRPRIDTTDESPGLEPDSVAYALVNTDSEKGSARSDTGTRATDNIRSP
jgi:hypothetical protein